MAQGHRLWVEDTAGGWGIQPMAEGHGQGVALCDCWIVLKHCCCCYRIETLLLWDSQHHAVYLQTVPICH